MPLLEADHVDVDLGDRPVLRGVTFGVDAGHWVGLLGPNGSGKTTLMRAVAGVLPHRGRLAFDGKAVGQWSARDLARRMAFVRQMTHLSFDFSVEELVLLGRAPYKRRLEPYTRADRDRAYEALVQVELPGFAERSVLALSGGELQRVLLAQALVQEADLLLLDEPTAHLDVHAQYAFMEQVRRLIAAGRTVLAVFHDLELAARFADHLLVLDRGRLVASGPPAEILTPSLIADVFRMEADVAPGDGGGLRIHYLAPL